MATQVAVGRLPEAPSQVINREKVVDFVFDGKTYSAYEGDTIASALAAAGVTTFSRSFKYHRRRGLLCVAGACPNCLVQVGDEANVRSCTTPVQASMKVEAQNAVPSLDADIMSATQLVDRFLPAGFYYKAFIRPQALWPTYERFLRHAAGLGKIDPDSEPGYFDKIYKHTDVTVIGGGPAGLRAALTAAKSGAQVILMDDQPALGGHLRYRTDEIDGVAGHEYVAKLAAELVGFANVEILANTTAIGRYDHNWIGAISGNRLTKLRTKALVVTTGAYEILPLFENNDLPGIMLGSAAQRMIHLWGVVPGTRAVVVSANRRGLQAVLDLIAAGIHVEAVAEMRDAPDADLIQKLSAAHVMIFKATTIKRAWGIGKVQGAALESLQTEQIYEFPCDLLVVSTGYMPANQLLFQAGSKLKWNERINEFTFDALPPDVFAGGEAAATHTLEDIEREGELAGLQAAQAAGFGDEAENIASLAQKIEARRAERIPWTQIYIAEDEAKKDFVCFCEDVTRKEIKQSIQEGFDSVELLKRYSTVSMGPCQGKMCNINAIHLCAHYNQKTVAETGITTSRPPVTPVTLGALGGRLMEPVRLSPMHDWHVSHGAAMMNAGLWKRPDHYGDPSAEVRAVRERVGLIDVTPLGKFHLHGPGVSGLLERVYTNRWQKLDVGRVRYGLMVNEEGVVLDDGVTARLEDDFFYMTATSSGASGIFENMEWNLQSGWLYDVHLLNATDLRAAMNLAGPRSRDLLAKVTQGVDLSNTAFPYMHVRQATVAGVPALLLRIGFTGELSYEIHVPSGYGLHVWEALLKEGEEFGIVPFGVEAQRVLRLEKGHIIVSQDTDGLTNPFEAGMEWAVKLDKQDFTGKASLMMANQKVVTKKLVGFEMTDGTMPEEANQIVTPGNGPIGLEIIGRITSVRRSPTLKKVIGLCWLPTEMSEPGQEFTVRVHGQMRTGRVVTLPFYDPDGLKLNS
jgi:sarcosine oxidase, subunit alpha